MVGANTEQRYYHPEVNIARGIGLVLVVLGHSFPDADIGISNFGCLWCHTYLYTFHMALFFFLSGLVSSRKILAGDYAIGSEIKKKSLRLLIPYFLYSLVTLFPKLMLSKYANNPFDISEIGYLFLGKSPNGGMWFLWTLFVISVLYLLLGKALVRCKYRLLIFLLAGVILYLLLGVKFAMFYALGICEEKYYEKLKRFLRPGAAFLCIIIGILIAEPNVWNERLYPVTALIGIYTCYTLACRLAIKDNKIGRIFDTLGTYSYDIYLLCYFVQMPIRIICYQIFSVQYWLVVFLMFSCSIIIPYFVTKKLIRGHKWLERLLLGMWK